MVWVVNVISTIYIYFFIVMLKLCGVNGRFLMYGLLYWLLLLVMFQINVSFELIDEKLASFHSFEMYLGTRYSNSFLVQYILALPMFSLFESEYTAHALNIALQSLFFVLFLHLVGSRHLKIALAGLLLYPAFIHYTVSGLRDPLLNLVSLAIVYGAIVFDKTKFLFLCCVLAVVCNFIRPEYSLIIGGLIFLRYYVDLDGKKAKLITIVCGLAALYCALLVMPLAFGMPVSSNAFVNVETMIQFNTLRHDRTVGLASTHILGGALLTYPIFIRYPIQVVASFVTPLPMDFRGGVMLFAALDSLIFCVVVFVAYLRSKLSKTATFLFYCGAVYILLQALFAFNYGNLLRVRYPSYIFFLASVCFANLSWSTAGRPVSGLR